MTRKPQLLTQALVGFMLSREQDARTTYIQGFRNC